MTEQVRGLSYVPQIKEAYAELIATNESKLKLGLKLGGLLNDAKDAVGKKRQWMKFREDYFPEISHSTANVYMNLAKNKHKFDDNPANSQRAVNLMVEKDLSIRGAIELLKTEDEKAAAKAKKEKERAEKETKKKAEADAAKAAAKSQDLAVVLEDKAPDELLLALGSDKEKKDELLKQQLKSLTPYSLVDFLAKVWEVDQLRRLGEEIADHVKRKAEPAPVLRRPAVTGAQATA